MIKYHYAYDENHNLVNIILLDRDIAKTHSYYCVGCGNELFPKLGDIKAHHFSHKKDVDCDGQSYLHKLAKIKFKEKFDDKDKPFNIQLRRHLICKMMDECPFFEKMSCKKYTLLKEINLHQYYDTCTEERAIYVDNSGLKPVIYFNSKEDREKYIADLLLNDSRNKNKAPTLIEIYCSHKCEIKKTSSKLKIIEIHISSDVDIDKWFTNTIVEDNDEYNDLKTKEVKFINFNPHLTSDVELGIGHITRFVYYNNGNSYVNNYDQSLTCEKLHTKQSQYSLIELNIPCEYLDFPNPYHFGLVYLLNNGYKIRNCMLCKYYAGYEANGPICCLYKKYGTPIYPKQNEALTCQYYVINKSFIKKIQLKLGNIKIIEV
jgi:hypothetical protein